MAHVTIRELRNNGGEVVDRAARGEEITITRAGKPVAELRPVPADGIDAAQLLMRWRRLPRVDGRQFREDVDEVLNSEL